MSSPLRSGMLMSRMHQIPAAGAQLIERLVARGRLADFGDAAILVQKLPQSGPHHRVIVGY